MLTLHFVVHHSIVKIDLPILMCILYILLVVCDEFLLLRMYIEPIDPVKTCCLIHKLRTSPLCLIHKWSSISCCFHDLLCDVLCCTFQLFLYLHLVPSVASITFLLPGSLYVLLVLKNLFQQIWPAALYQLMILVFLTLAACEVCWISVSNLCYVDSYVHEVLPSI